MILGKQNFDFFKGSRPVMKGNLVEYIGDNVNDTYELTAVGFRTTQYGKQPVIGLKGTMHYYVLGKSYLTMFNDLIDYIKENGFGTVNLINIKIKSDTIDDKPIRWVEFELDVREN